MYEEWMENFLLLGLRIGKKFKEKDNQFVDAYIGPERLEQIVKNKEKIGNPELLNTAEKLITGLEEMNIEDNRKEYLKKQLIAMETVLRILNQEELEFKYEVENIFDIKPRWIEEKHFEEGLNLYQEGLPGNGKLDERFNIWSQRNFYEFDSNESKKNFIIFIINELKKRTTNFINLPEQEDLVIKMVSDKRFGASTRYLGNYRSKIEINDDIPFNFFLLLPLISHELYPGHHTEFCLKEENLIEGKNYTENNIFILYSPWLVIAEGLAEVAFEMLFKASEAAEWLKDNIYSQYNINTDDVGLNYIIRASRLNSLDQISSNAAIMIEEGKPEDEVKNYIKKYTLQTDYMVNHIVQNLQSSEFKRIYSFAYSHGSKIIRDYLNKGDKKKRLIKLLGEQCYPSGL
ncbi:MAG: hypothetical protein R6V14_01355 [Halanaerobiales bacterium]